MMQKVVWVLLAILYIAISIEYRLPTTIKPIEYDITLHPHFDTLTFDGKVTILLDISQEYFNNNLQNNFVLQLNKGDNVTINDAILNVCNGSQLIQYINSDYNTETQIVSIEFGILNTDVLDDINSACNISVYIDYNGILRDDMRGFYISSYKVIICIIILNMISYPYTNENIKI